MQKYYALEKNGKTADLYIFGDITSWPWLEKDRDAYGIVKELNQLDSDEINVHINSYGGEVAEGLAIYNTLKNSNMKVTTYCDGFACSAASVIFMAGDERVMNSASLLMIHNAWSYGRGDANDFRKQAEDLDKITQASVNAYMSRVWLSEEELKAKMDEESWITAEEAVTDGFATKVLETEDDKANQSAFTVVRERLLNPMAELEEIAPVQEYPDVNEIAEKVVEKLAPLLNDKKEHNKKTENGASWSTFFNGGK